MNKDTRISITINLIKNKLALLSEMRNVECTTCKDCEIKEACKKIGELESELSGIFWETIRKLGD